MLPVIGLLLPCAGQHLLEPYGNVSSIWRTILGCQNKIMCICSTKVQGLEIFLNSSIWPRWQAHFPSLHQPVKGQQIRELQTLILAYSKSHVGSPARLQRAVLHREGAVAEMEPSPSHGRCGNTWDTLGWASKPLVAMYSCPNTRSETFCPSLAATRISLAHCSSPCSCWGGSLPPSRTTKPQHWLSGRISLKASAHFSLVTLCPSGPTYSDSFMSCISTPSIWVDSVFTMHKEIFMQRRHLLEVLSPQLGALFFHAEILASGHKVPLPVSNKWKWSISVPNFSFCFK